MLYEIYKLLQELECKINGNVRVSISTTPRIIIFTAYWTENLFLKESYDMMDIVGSNIELKDFMDMFAVKCNVGYREHMEKLLKG